MQNRFIKIFITAVAVAVIVVRVYKPELTLDVTTLALVALAILPWLSAVVKSFEVFGIKFEFQNAEHKPDSTADRHPTTPSYTPDSYLVRLMKLTPVETVVTFILTNAMVTLTGSAAMIWANSLALVAVTPFFLWRISGVTTSGQLVASTIVLVGWIFALGGPFAMLEWYTPLLGALVLALITLMVPIFRAR
jgi:hypothetical protein